MVEVRDGTEEDDQVWCAAVVQRYQHRHADGETNDEGMLGSDVSGVDDRVDHEQEPNILERVLTAASQMSMPTYALTFISQINENYLHVYWVF